METKRGSLSSVPMKLAQDYEDLLRPELFTGSMEGRLTKPLGLKQFGVNYITLEPGSASSLRHWHEGEDEFVFVLEGEPTLVDENGEHLMAQGDYVAFPAGEANGDHLINKSEAPVALLVVGSRRPGEDCCHYPDDDIGPIPR